MFSVWWIAFILTRAYGMDASQRKRLAYNCSPSFNWKANLDDATIARFQDSLAEMGYACQFILTCRPARGADRRGMKR